MSPLLRALALAATPPLMLATALHPRTRSDWAARWGLRLPPVEPGAVVVHGASVGEGRAARAVLEALERALPPGTVRLRTAFTDTGLATARGHDALAALPMDAPGLAARWVDRLRPRALVLIEAELWPGLLAACRARGVPVWVAGARAGPGLRRLARLAPGLLAELDLAVVGWLARDGASAEALRALGLRHVQVVGDPKLDAAPAPCPLRFSRPLWVGASTREGDERALLAAVQGRAQLLLAPRHPRRFDEVAGLLAASGCRWARRSALQGEEVPGDVDVLLLDTLGELAGLLDAAELAFVGGTFDAALGGHSPAEALASGLPVVVGPEHWGHAALLPPGRHVVAPSTADLGEALARARALGRAPPARHGAADRVAACVAGALGSIPEERPHRPALAPLAAAVAALARWRARRRAPGPGVLPTVSVGNLASGGSGKTQVVRWLLQATAARRPAVLARGYRRAGRGQEVRGSWTRQDADWLGDELGMLAAEGWLAVSAPRRPEGALAAARAGAGLLVVDDGLQRHDLPRDLDLVVVDALHPLAGGVLPCGEAREGPEALARADVLWVMGEALPPALAPHLRPDALLVLARPRPGSWRLGGRVLPAEDLRGREVLAFAGVAHPGRFLATLVALGVRVRAWRAFPDHHRWSAAQLAALRREAGGALLITTAKDHARLGAPEDVAALDLSLELLQGEAALRARLEALSC